jgi:hypothetical protein
MSATPAMIALVALVGSGAEAASLKAVADAAAAAHRDPGQKQMVQTPGPGSLSITAGSAASDAIDNDTPPPDRWEMEAIVDGTAVARYGSLAGRAHAEASSLPANASFLAGGEVSLNVGYVDGAEVLSDTLPDGTPVTLTFLMTLDAAATHFTDPSFPNPDGTGASARHELVLRDADVIVQPPALGALVINSRGVLETSRVVELDTAVGHRIEIVADLFLGAGVDIEDGVTLYSQGAADVLAENTAELVFQPSGDVTLATDSGHDYAAPEPGRGVLLAVGLATLVWRSRRGRR